MTSDFSRRVENIPWEWRGPLVDVIDTADAVRLALREWGIDSPELILGLTELVLRRHDACTADVELLPDD